jgi:deoxyribonuclease-4
MAILGAHQSIAGGYDKAAQRAQQCGCDCLQLFTRNNNQWRARPITAPEAELFRAAVARLGLSHPLAHDSYLINLASVDDLLWRKSIDAMVMELSRAEALGIPRVVAHPGAYTTGVEGQGLRRVVQALDEIRARTGKGGPGCLLETTAGQGTSLGWRFEHLAELLGGVQDSQWLGVCFDTCHVFAAGYPLRTARQYQRTMDDFDRVVGLRWIQAFHLNDSRCELGSRVDRHAHIGRGKLGRAAFRHLLGDPRFQKTPMYLETPKGMEDGVDMDVTNLRLLRRMCGRKDEGGP